MKFELNAQKRVLQGSGASRRLRRANKVPGIIYGGTTAPEMIEIAHNELLLALRKEAFHSSVVSIKLDGSEQTVLLRNAQMHAYKPLVLHVDFQRVDTTHAIQQKVPLHFINADLAPGVKLGGGRIAHAVSEIEVACLPQDLPSFIEVDLKDLENGQSLHVSQLTLPQGVKAVVHGDDQVVATLIAKKGGAEDEAAPAA